MPIQSETHEELPQDVKQHARCGIRSLNEQASDMQSVMAALAGYFGGYTSKMQPIGERETQQLRNAAQRRVDCEPSEGRERDFQKSVRRLVKDLEMKGTIRTAVESANLSLYAKNKDILKAECIRTFPHVNFPASLLLKREEIETLKVAGTSIIAALYRDGNTRARMYAEATFDLMYGFRGSEDEVDVLSPYEMILLYSMERICPPNPNNEKNRATWTDEGNEYRRACRDTNQNAKYKPGEHYKATPAKGRILLPDIDALHGLRHSWCWERRRRLHLPTWSFSKVPQAEYSPEENARLLSVYMRPWTLNPMESTKSNPLLALLGKCTTLDDERVPVWTQLPSATVSMGSHSQEIDAEKADTTHAVDPGENRDSTCRFQSKQESTTPAKRRRLTKKSTMTSRKNKKANSEHHDRLCYATSWEHYIEGNIISETSRQYISNLLAATAAVKNADSDDSSGDSEWEEWRRFDSKIGDMDLVRKTLHGIASRSKDEGVKAIGRHERSIRLGRSMCQSPPLSEEIRSRIEETCFDENYFPPPKDIAKALAEVRKKENENRPRPFEGKTQPQVSPTTVKDYEKKIKNWIDKVKKESETPTCEQLEILTAIADRVLMEFRVDKLGLHLKKNDPNRENQERPMLGFVHGSPGTGKSRVIKWIRRLFIEALEWKHGDEFLFVAFQNRVAHAMEGTTIHAGGDIGVGGARSMRLEHTDVDVLYTRNQLLRWIIIDEMSMVPDELLGIFEHHLTDAAARTRYSQRCDGTNRPFGGYNVMGFGDFFQIPPIPSTASLTIPPIEKKTEHASKALDLLWGDGADALNFFAELTLQKRIDDKGMQT